MSERRGQGQRGGKGAGRGQSHGRGHGGGRGHAHGRGGQGEAPGSPGQTKREGDSLSSPFGAPLLDPAQLGLGDMSPGAFREAAHRVADMVADYLESLESYRVVPDIEPGTIRERAGGPAPQDPAPLDAILGDYKELVEPNITHWQHPGFMAYFCSTATGPNILGEWLAAGLNSNVMFWRNAPASTEIEEVVVAWLRELMGLPAHYDGMLTDTASISSLLSLVAARHVVEGAEARERGLAGSPQLVMYMSSEAHSSIEKGAIVAGIGREGVRRIPADEHFRMQPDALAEAIRDDRAAGRTPFLVVATLGTTSSTSVDPTAALAAICEREKLWLHVDAAYAGTAALVPEMRHHFEGWERADSIVVNPHKWMFTAFDASLLLTRRLEDYRAALSLVPEYLRVRDAGQAHDFHEYGIQLGRRFRALKLWMHLRYFGGEGIARRIRDFCRQAKELEAWVDEATDFERLAPVPFSTVCLRHVPEGMEPEALDAHNEALLERINAGGRYYLSHTKLAGRYAIRVTLGNPRAGDERVRGVWDEICRAARG